MRTFPFASRKFLRSTLSILTLTLTGGILVGCDDLLKDSTFRLWCGDSLCEWKTEAGTIRKAPTWHQDDVGVEFVDTPTEISQESTSAATCIQFTTVADVDASAQFTIGVDFNRDGTIDVTQPIAATGFREAKTVVTPPATFDGLRIVLRKNGSGRAVLAQIRAQAVDPANCSAPAVALVGQSLGTACAGNAECASGVCCDGACSDCCGGPTDPGNTGRPSVACDDGAACERRSPYAAAASIVTIPWQCAPGQGQAEPSDACVSDDDCRSGVCEGAVIRGRGPDGQPCIADVVPVDAPGLVDGKGCVFTSMSGGLCK